MFILRRTENIFCALVGVILALVLCITPALSHAASDSRYASLVIDAKTGVVLHQENAGQTRYPASLTKMMTLYMTFQALNKGKLRMEQPLRVSARAEAQPASKLGLRRGQTIRVQEAVLALIVKSANDAAVVLGEAVGGTEWQFATMMTRMAKKLGMDHTNFANASGLHDRNQFTTAYDLARLAVALRRDFPQYYPLFNRNSFQYNGRVYNTHNNVTKRYRGADGLKTGYVNASGYNLVTSARRGNSSLVGVVLGGRTSRGRDQHMMKLLDQAFYKMTHGEVRTTKNINVNKKPSAVEPASGVPTPTLKPRASMQVQKNAPGVPSPILKPENTEEIRVSEKENTRG